MLLVRFACVDSQCHLFSGDKVVILFLVWEAGEETPSQGKFMFVLKIHPVPTLLSSLQLKVILISEQYILV